MKFLDILLKEGRKEDLKKKYSDKFNEDTLDWILNISDLVDFNHKYTDFVLKTIDPESDIAWWVESTIDELKVFDKYQSQFEKKDINQYKSFDELQSAVSSFKQKEKEKELESQTEKIYEDDNFLVLIPKTEEASCKYGSGTKWCVTQKYSGHFGRYTSGKQALYFILRKKGNQTEPHYKIAVHINELGNETWWDAKDNPMDRNKLELFKEYFSEVYSTILEHNKEKRKIDINEVNKIFEKTDTRFQVFEDFKSSGKDLKITVGHFELIPDMPGKAMGRLLIIFDDKTIDVYDIYVSFSLKEESTINLSVGFDSYGEFDEMGYEPLYDFKLWEGWGFDETLKLKNETVMDRVRIFSQIIKNVFQKIQRDPKFEAYVRNIEGNVWRPNRMSYGYTFRRTDKGLVKKLIDYLDSGYDNGTKLDFLEYIGKLKKKVDDNGSVWYSQANMNDWHPSPKWRGHFSSFFSSAKLAGIIEYVKQGNKFIIKKGPNFDAFKRGELKAL